MSELPVDSQLELAETIVVEGDSGLPRPTANGAFKYRHLPPLPRLTGMEMTRIQALRMFLMCSTGIVGVRLQ